MAKVEPKIEPLEVVIPGEKWKPEVYCLYLEGLLQDDRDISEALRDGTPERPEPYEKQLIELEITLPLPCPIVYSRAIEYGRAYTKIVKTGCLYLFKFDLAPRRLEIVSIAGKQRHAAENLRDGIKQLELTETEIRNPEEARKIATRLARTYHGPF